MLSQLPTSQFSSQPSYLLISLQAGVEGGRVLEYEGVELVVEVQHAVVAARLAPLRDGVALRRHDQLRLRVVAFRTQHELANESGEEETSCRQIFGCELRYHITPFNF